MCVWLAQKDVVWFGILSASMFQRTHIPTEDRNVIVEWCRCRFKQKIACSVWTRVDHKLTGYRMSGRHSVDCRDGDESKMFLLNQLVVKLIDATHQFIVLHVIELWLFGVSFVSDGISGIPSHWTSDIKVIIAPLSHSSWIYFCCLCSPNELWSYDLWWMETCHTSSQSFRLSWQRNISLVRHHSNETRPLIYSLRGQCFVPTGCMNINDNFGFICPLCMRPFAEQTQNQIWTQRARCYLNSECVAHV